MEIDLQELNLKDLITIDNDITFNKEIYKDTEIISLENCHVKGTIKSNASIYGHDVEEVDTSYDLEFLVNGTMILHDAIDYKEIPYNFSINIEEILENSLKTLDLNEFLWHYIVLEIPLRFTTCNDIEKIEKDGYQVISEEEYKKMNNPFKDYFEE